MASVPKHTPTPRTYEVGYRPDHWGHGLVWACTMRGDGHWCRGPQRHLFRTQEAAEAVGRAWIETGRDA